MLRTFPFAASRRRVFYGWWMVLVGSTNQAIINMVLNRAFAAYAVLLESHFGWSKTAIAGAFSLQQAENGILGPVQGWLIDRFGPKASMRLGIIMFGLGFTAFSQVNSLTSFYLVFLMMAVGASLGGFFPVNVVIANWFDRKRARAFAWIQLGGAVGGLLIPITALMLETLGWRTTAFVSGVFVLLVCFPLNEVIRHRPEEHGQQIDGVSPEERDSSASRPSLNPERDFSLREALRTKAFWLVSLGHGSSLLIVSAVNAHIILHLTSGLGYSLGEAALVVSLIPAGQIAGTAVSGVIGDRFQKRLIAFSAMGFHSLALLLVTYAEWVGMVIVFAVLHGTAWGLRGPMMQAIRADYFGRSAYGAIMGTSSTIIMFGTISGPIIAGLLADRTGNYVLGFTLLAIVSGMGSVFFLMARRPNPPEPASARRTR